MSRLQLLDSDGYLSMPWSPTRVFAHPLANMQSTNVDANIANYISYGLVEMLIWQGIGSLVNSFRRRTLQLERIDSTWAPGVAARLKIPFTYCWFVRVYSETFRES